MVAHVRDLCFGATRVNGSRNGVDDDRRKSRSQVGGGCPVKVSYRFYT